MVNIFILGRPGSGKTTAANYLNMKVKDELTSVLSLLLDDYPFLRDMSRSEKYGGMFLLKDCGGFDVRDFSVLNKVLRILKMEIKKRSDSYNFITVEFARDDYSQAFDILFEDISDNLPLEPLKDTYFLYLETDVEICLQRIHERMAHPSSENDHSSLSDNGFRRYYGKDNWFDTVTCLKEKYHLPDQQFFIIQNEGTGEEFTNALEACFKNKVLQAFYVSV